MSTHEPNERATTEVSFDAWRTRGMVVEELYRILDALAQLCQVGTHAPAQDVPVTASAQDFDVLKGLQRALFRHPLASQHLFSALVAEGRRFAQTPEGQQLRQRLATSEAVRTARRVWETSSLNMLENDPSVVVPSRYVEALFRFGQSPKLEALLDTLAGLREDDGGSGA